MLHRRTLLAGFAALAALPVSAQPAPMPVVASFSILGDLVRQIGGERVSVTTLVGPHGDAHGYTPRPADSRALAAARVVFVNGFGLEGWMPRLARASGTTAPIVEAAAAVDRLPAERRDDAHGHPHGGTDPHAWQSVGEAKRYVAAIRDALIAADGDGRAAYEANAARYGAELDRLDAEIRATIERIPAASRRAVTTHDAFGYFERAYGFRFIAAQGVSSDAEPTPRRVAELIRQLRSESVRAVFLENISDPRLIERIAREGRVRAGGTLYSDALSGADGPAATYIAMMRHNARTIAAAFTGS